MNLLELDELLNDVERLDTYDYGYDPCGQETSMWKTGDDSGEFVRRTEVIDAILELRNGQRL